MLDRKLRNTAGAIVNTGEIYAVAHGYERDVEGNNSRYVLQICFSHPSFSEDAIAAGLAWGLSFTPAEVGDGDERERCGSDAGERTDYRYFFQHLTSALEHIEGRRPFIAYFRATGGGIVFTLRLDGRANIGDALPPGTLMRLAKLGVRLRIEVVPVWSEG